MVLGFKAWGFQGVRAWVLGICACYRLGQHETVSSRSRGNRAWGLELLSFTRGGLAPARGFVQTLNTPNPKP